MFRSNERPTAARAAEEPDKEEGGAEDDEEAEAEVDAEEGREGEWVKRLEAADDEVDETEKGEEEADAESGKASPPAAPEPAGSVAAELLGCWLGW